jgi:hypothetical protein
MFCKYHIYIPMKKLMALTILCMVALSRFGQGDSASSINNVAIQSGVGLGSVIAVVTS